MNWYIGQQVVAIRSRKDKLIVKGQDFKIQGIRASLCKCNYTLIDVGLKNPINKHCCKRCGTYDIASYELWTRDTLFAPLDQDISELTEILELQNVNLK